MYIYLNIYKRFCLPKLHIVTSNLGVNLDTPIILAGKIQDGPQMVKSSVEQFILTNKALKSNVLRVLGRFLNV